MAAIPFPRCPERRWRRRLALRASASPPGLAITGLGRTRLTPPSDGRTEQIVEALVDLGGDRLAKRTHHQAEPHFDVKLVASHADQPGGTRALEPQLVAVPGPSGIQVLLQSQRQLADQFASPIEAELMAPMDGDGGHGSNAVRSTPLIMPWRGGPRGVIQTAGTKALATSARPLLPVGHLLGRAGGYLSPRRRGTLFVNGEPVLIR